MKLFFNIAVFIWALPTCARNIVIITYNHQEEKAHMVKKIMHKKMNIPLLLIEKRWQKRPCLAKKDAVLQICLQDDGGIYFPVLKKDVLLRSFKIFKQK